MVCYNTQLIKLIVEMMQNNHSRKDNEIANLEFYHQDRKAAFKNFQIK